MSARDNKAVFLSYASQDVAAVLKICEALRAVGIEVWFDQNELVGGDAWDRKIRQQIKECALFLPLISTNTQARREGYFRIEWRLAAQRTHAMADGTPFLVPIVIDGTRDAEALVPDEFRAVQWTRLRAGATNEALGARIQKLLGCDGVTVDVERSTALMSRQEQPAPRRSGAAPWTMRGRSLVFGAAGLLLAGAIWLLALRDRPGAREITNATTATHPSGNPDEANPVATVPISAPVKPPGSVSDEKSLVVLPLENFSPDPSDALFVDGMHAEIISTLGRIPGLRVISRSSASRYRDSKLSLAQIAHELDVSNIVTGNVRRTGPKVRISLELRRAADETLLWSSPPEEHAFADLWALQDAIAEEMARVLQVRTSSGSYAGARFMTRSSEAYQFFLEAREITRAKGPMAAAMREQAGLCERALQLDPDFMAAASLASSAYAYWRTTEGDPVERRRLGERAKFWAEHAAKLMPDGAGDGALAVYYYLVESEPARALKYAENEARALPNEANAHNRLAVYLMSYGRYSDAEVEFTRTLAIDPLHVRALHNRVTLYARLHRVEAFEVAAARSLELGGMNVDFGRIQCLRARLTGKLPRGGEMVVGFVNPEERAKLFFFARDFSHCLPWIDPLLAAAPVGRQERPMLLRIKAQALAFSGRGEQARAVAGELLALFARETPADLASEKNWGLVLSGRAAEAIAASRQAIAAASDPSRTETRWARESELAEFYAYSGGYREAVELLARLLREPSGVMVHALELAPVWDGIRAQPAFKALLSDPANSAPL